MRIYVKIKSPANARLSTYEETLLKGYEYTTFYDEKPSNVWINYIYHPNYSEA